MFSPRWQKVMRDLGNNKIRTLLVVLSIAVGVFAVGSITSTQIMLSNDLSASYLSANPASATLSVTPFDRELVRSVRRMPGVAEAEGERSTNVRVKTGPSEWKTLRLKARENLEDVQINRLTPELGTWPPAKREVAIERSSLSLLKATVGDTVTVETPDGKQYDLSVSGTIHDVNSEPAVFTGNVLGYVSLDTLDALKLPRTFTNLHIVVSEQVLDKAHVQAVADEVKRRIEQGNYTVAQAYVPTPGEHPANEVVQPLLLILSVLGALSLFLSGFLVVNTVTALLAQQVPQIGVMKAIGARTSQLLSMYLATVLAYGVLSLGVAVPLGGLAAYALTSYMASLINFDLQGFRIPQTALIMEVAVALLVPLLAALWPVLSGTRITVREALSAQGKASFGRSRFDRLINRVRGLPRPVLLSLRNTFRCKSRLALTLTTLTLGGAIFIAVLSVHASLMNTLDDALAYWRYDVEVQFAEPHRIDQIAEEVKRVPGVVAVESWAYAGAQRVYADEHQSGSLFMLGTPADTQMISPTILEGRWLQADDDDAVVLNTEVTKKETDLRVGDEITLKIGKKDTTWRVVGIVRGVMTGPVIYANFPSVARVTNSQGRAGRVQIITEKHDAASQQAMAAALKTHLDDGHMRVTSTQTLSSIRQGVESQLNIIVALMAIMAVLMAVVGGLGLMGTMSMNVLERSREIGVMRAIGASTGAMLQIFIVEGLLIGVLSWLVGAGLAFPISKLLSDAVGMAFFEATLSYAFSFQGALLWLGLVLGLAALASLLPSLRAARLTVRAVLAYE